MYDSKNEFLLFGQISYKFNYPENRFRGFLERNVQKIPPFKMISIEAAFQKCTIADVKCKIPEINMYNENAGENEVTFKLWILSHLNFFVIVTLISIVIILYFIGKKVFDIGI
jgi:hypothetical protein